MDTRRVAHELRLQHWSNLMREAKSSGLSNRGWCRENGIQEKTFYYWQRKLREAACREILPDAGNSEEKALVPSGWAVCVPKQSGSDESAIIIEIGQFKVKVACNANPEALEKVCRVLMRLC